MRKKRFWLYLYIACIEETLQSRQTAVLGESRSYASRTSKPRNDEEFPLCIIWCSTPFHTPTHTTPIPPIACTAQWDKQTKEAQQKRLCPSPQLSRTDAHSKNHLLLENRREHRVNIFFNSGNDERLSLHHAVLEGVPELVVRERHHSRGWQPILLVPAYPAERLPLRVYQ